MDGLPRYLLPGGVEHIDFPFDSQPLQELWEAEITPGCNRSNELAPVQTFRGGDDPHFHRLEF
ncbi:hypothetical protein DPMN_024763 [Dreissena polymorpha]|uniref:Uncharacterized protein n=1 Tax=Dreissena polymorpha TaxID=45954 RepID=A0A9D4RCM9_DREPO|nr:hypothetical protein DPMN_024763 [Dreissena polymorpha]